MKEITPGRFKCGVSIQCEAAYELDDGRRVARLKILTLDDERANGLQEPPAGELYVYLPEWMEVKSK